MNTDNGVNPIRETRRKRRSYCSMIFRFRLGVQGFMIASAGEAETGNAGEQPDRGIAGRNSSADDEMERDPPGTFYYLGSGPTIGRRHGPTPGFGIGF